MFTSREIKQEHKLATRMVRTNDNRKGGRQCVPLTLMDEQESIIPIKLKSEPREEKRIGDLIVRRF